MYCPYCREQLKDTDRFCTRCGKQIPDFARPRPAVVGGAADGAPGAAGASAPAPKAAAPRPVPGSPVPVVLAVVAILLALGAAAVLLLAPLVALTPVADPSGLLLSAVARFDGPFAVASVPWIGQEALSGVALVELASSYADEGGALVAAVALGGLLGLAASVGALLVAGAVSVALRRRPTGLLVAACVGTALIALALLGGVLALDVSWTPQLKSAVGALYGGVGPQVTAPGHVALPTPWLVVAAALSVGAWATASAARRRWATEHPRLR